MKPESWVSKSVSPFLKIYLFIYLFLERGEGRDKEKERNINVWLPLTCPQLGASGQPKHMPRLGIEPAALWFAGWHSVH